MLRFPIFGIPVTVHPGFWVVSAIFGGALSSDFSPESLLRVATWMAIVFLSILWHELGHAYYIRKYGGQPEIELVMMGGLAYGRPPRLTPARSIIISAAGPAAQLLIGLVVWYIYPLFAPGWFGTVLLGDEIPEWRLAVFNYIRHHPLGGSILFALFWVNIVWAIINLMPVYPLDGGKIAMTLFGPRREKMALQLSIVSAAVLCGVGLYLGQAFMGIMFGMFAWNSWQLMNNQDGTPWMGGR